MKLNKTSAAFILHSDMAMEMKLPKVNDDGTDIPENFYIVAGIGLLMSDENYREKLLKLIDERMYENEPATDITQALN